MAQIEKLEMIGFKSFCDRTQLSFHQGITAVVGPNGCGKSNIADAISWVVGEQSAKSLRTDRMEGIIFNGTQARKATSMAEVILSLKLLDNLRVPEGLDLNPEGFTVGRRLYRSGESEYYLDGRRCRLKDILALFEGTGLGPNSYALMEQGRIGQILSSKPADRRSLIEEAARITLFKSRRYSAEMKLELAQQNLARVQDIIREVARQLNSLKRQAAKARRYNRLRDELRGVHKLKLGLEQRELAGKLEACTRRFSEAVEWEQSILRDLARAEDDRSQSQEACRRQEELAHRSREDLGNLKLEAERAQGAKQQQEVQKDDLEKRLKDLERETISIEERRALIEREQERLQIYRQQLLEEISTEREVLDREQARNEELVQAIRETEGKIEELRSSLLNGAGELSDLRNLQARCQENIQRLRAGTARLEFERHNKAQERARFLSQLEDFRRKATGNLSVLEELAERRGRSETALAELQAKLEQVSTEITAKQEEWSLMQHRHSSLEEVERRRSNYSEGVQKFLSTRLQGEKAPARQTLADHVETDPRYEAAVEDYLNGPLQYILVDGLDEAVESVERLKRIGAGKCTFMTLHGAHSNGNGHGAAPRPHLEGEGIVGFLDELLRMREDVKQAFERTLPDYASTVMVSDLGTAFRVAESNPYTNFLTLSGEAYSPRGTLSAVGERKSMAGFLALKREKRELEEKLESLQAKIQVARAELERLKGEQTAAHEVLKSLDGEARKLELEAVIVDHQIARVEAEVAKIDQTDDIADDELAQLLAEKQEFESKGSEAQRSVQEIEERSRSGEQQLRELGLRLESSKSESFLVARSVATVISSQAVKHERRESTEADLRRLSGESKEVSNRLEVNRAEKNTVQVRIGELERAQRETQARIDQLLRLVQERETELAGNQAELTKQRKSLAELEERLRRLHVEREESMGDRGRIEIEKTRLESDLEHLERSCQDEFHASLAEILGGIPADDWQRDYLEVSQFYDQLRQRIETFGAINMRALEEYQELDERFQFLNRQRADIEQSISDTQKAIADINRRSIEQFQDAFTSIRQNFVEVFQALFNGGQCDLRLLDEEDTLESGIDIIAQPPGKRLQNVLLLSGGEKALTALALLIAIFKYRPSPFCVLDEVDAPLDDANVNRFTQLMSKLSDETQFIIITHNKRTMEIAQTLYGVTMEEPGVSKIVGVDFRPKHV
jgi:chromosome segregation protein